MSPRLKLRAASPLVLAGALWSGATLAPPAFARAPYGAPCQTPPPCAPDGVCLPKYESYGWYQTHWRHFPGDMPPKAPTKAETTPKPGEEKLSGPQPPPPSQEGELGKPRPPRGGAAGPDEGATEPPIQGPEAGLTPGPGATPAPEATPPGLPAIPGGAGLPGAAPPEGGALQGPGGGAAPAGPGALGPGLGAPGATAPMPAPGPATPAPQGAAPKEKAPAPETPEQKLVDPFGAAPPQPPAWLRSAAAEHSSPAVQPQPLPAVQTAGITQPAGVLPVVTPAGGLSAPAREIKPAVFETPNLIGDDAPPALPAELQQFTAAPVVRSNAATPKTMPPQPSRVVTASAEQPPTTPPLQQAEAIGADPSDGGPQQAIYFEASDQQP